MSFFFSLLLTLLGGKKIINMGEACAQLWMFSFLPLQFQKPQSRQRSLHFPHIECTLHYSKGSQHLVLESHAIRKNSQVRLQPSRNLLPSPTPSIVPLLSRLCNTSIPLLPSMAPSLHHISFIISWCIDLTSEPAYSFKNQPSCLQPSKEDSAVINNMGCRKQIHSASQKAWHSLSCSVPQWFWFYYVFTNCPINITIAESYKSWESTPEKRKTKYTLRWKNILYQVLQNLN